MENNRADNRTSERGIALITALIITIVVMMLIGSLTYLFTTSFQTNIINRRFSTTYEAANGGAEYGAGLINTQMAALPLTDLGTITVSGGSSFNAIVQCSTTTQTATINAVTADNQYQMTVTIQCVGTNFIPGSEASSLIFPPKPAAAGGGISTGASGYNYYRIISQATEATNSTNISRTEALYRLVR